MSRGRKEGRPGGLREGGAGAAVKAEVVLEPTRDEVLAVQAVTADDSDFTRNLKLLRAARQPFYNTSAITLAKLGENRG